MNNEKLLEQLARIKENLKMACMGCGLEHNCREDGCAVIKAAMERLPVWHKMEDCCPENEKMQLVACRDKKGQYTINRAWFDGAFWHGCGSMAGVTHWMEMPKPPEVAEEKKTGMPCWPGHCLHSGA